MKRLFFLLSVLAVFVFFPNLDAGGRDDINVIRPAGNARIYMGTETEISWHSSPALAAKHRVVDIYAVYLKGNDKILVRKNCPNNPRINRITWNIQRRIHSSKLGKYKIRIYSKKRPRRGKRILGSGNEFSIVAPDFRVFNAI